MYLEIGPSGGKLWRLKYRFAGKYKLLALGAYPDVSLRDARERRDEARRLLSQGIDPSAVRREAKIRERAERVEAEIRERAEHLAAEAMPSVAIGVDETFEIRKGRALVFLTLPEAKAVHGILTRLLGGVAPCH